MLFLSLKVLFGPAESPRPQPTRRRRPSSRPDLFIVTPGLAPEPVFGVEKAKLFRSIDQWNTRAQREISCGSSPPREGGDELERDPCGVQVVWEAPAVGGSAVEDSL